MPYKIVHVLSSLQVGGAERFVIDLAEVQTARGDEVTVFSCSSNEDPLLKGASERKSNYVISSGNRWCDYYRLWAIFFGSREKIFHIHSPAALRYLTPVLPILFLSGIRVVYTRHGMRSLTSVNWRLVHAWARPFVRWVTFVSQAGLDVFQSQQGWPKQKHVLISNGILLPAVEGIEAEKKIRLGSVGRMVELKGQAHLIEAVAKLAPELRNNIEIHFFGDGPEMQSLVGLAEKSLDPDQAVFHGMELNRDKVYSKLDVLVVCSEQEGLSLVIMEAMARQIPVLATSVGDSPKLVINDKTGFLYDYGDIESLSELLKNISSDRPLIHRLGLNARKHIQQGFSLEATSDQYQKCYGA